MGDRPLVMPPTARDERTSRLKADGALVVLSAFWGVTFVVVKDALAHADPFSFLALRFLLGALALSVLVRRALLVPATLRHGALLGVFLFLGFAFQTTGLERTTPSRSAFLTGLYVLGVPFVSLALGGKVPRASSLLGVVLSASGLYFLVGADEGGATLSAGDVLTLLCALAYALHITLTERYAPRHPAAALTAVQLWVVALLSALCVPVWGARVQPVAALLGAVLFCGLFASALAIGVQTWAQARTSAVRAALIYALEPVFAAAYSVGVGHERLGAREWAGGGLIVAGVLVAELGALAWSRLRPARSDSV